MIISRILDVPKQSFLMLGPRGSGKSTWLKQMLPDAYVVDLLDETLFQHLLVDPGQFAAMLRAVPLEQWVVVDEIQRLPNLLNEVHRFIEERGIKFALCGSSARKLKRAGVNLLAGRAFRRFMHPFLPEEIGGTFSLDDAMRYGLLPVIWDSTSRDEALQAYSEMYLKEEIHAEALIRNLPGFSRFLPIAALYNGQTINASNIAREAGVARTTVNGYLDILEETLMCFRVPAYEAKLRVRERKLSKWYWCDPGVQRTMKRTRGSLTPEEKGALFEGMVAQLIRAYKDYRKICDEFFYWASSGTSSVEVDFLLARGDEFVAVEVKSGNAFSESWCRGLRAISGLKGLTRRIIVYPKGPTLQTEDNIDIFSFATFASLLAEGSF
ncbi:ATP-binding protein [Verrucomicrobiota bacterium]